MEVIAVDIGSTWTKAALFTREGERVVCQRRCAVSTTTGKLCVGFDAVVNDLRPAFDGPRAPSEVQIVCSSSAKGGLSVAAACLTGALERHAGRAQRVYTSDGRVTVQTGINLQRTEKLLLSGGFLSVAEMPTFAPLMRCDRLDSTGRAVLLPTSWQIHRDTENTFTLFAGAARVWPEHAALSAPGNRHAEVV